jgi:ribosome modulation factor
MTTVDLYKKHKSGNISREKFLYEVRRDTRLPFITNLTSYNDAVQILKNKSIIKEEAYPEEDPYNQGLAANKAHKSHTENPYNKTAFPQQNAAWHEGWMDGETENQMKHDEEQFRRERGGVDEEELNELSPELRKRAYDTAMDKADNAYYLNKSGDWKNDPLEKQKRLGQASTFGRTASPDVVKKVESIIGPDYTVKITKAVDKVYLDVYNKKTDTASKFEIEKDEYKIASGGGMPTPDLGRKIKNVIPLLQQKELAESSEDYNPEGAWQEGYDSFMAGHHQEENPYEGDTSEHKNWDMGYEKAQHDGPGMNEEENKVLGKDAQDIVDSIKNGKVDLEDLKAATEKAMKGDATELGLMMAGIRTIKEGKEVTIETVNPYEFRKGLSWELGYATKPSPDWDDSSITNEDMKKASKKVLKNLSSNPIYYTELIANKGEKAKKEKEVKVEEDGMAKIKGVEKVSANVQTSLGKKEKGKLRPEGVKEMKGSKKAFSKIKLMKENEEPIVDKKEAFKNKLKEMLKLEISDTLKQQISQEKKKLGQLYQKAGQQMANPTPGGSGNDPFGM